METLMESFEQALKDMYALGIKHGKEMQKKDAELKALEKEVASLEFASLEAIQNA